MEGRSRSDATAGKGTSKVQPPVREKRSNALVPNKGADAAATADVPDGDPQDVSSAPQEPVKPGAVEPSKWKSAQPGRDGKAAGPSKPGMLGQARARATRPRNAALESGKYAINTYLWTAGTAFVESTGSILSQSVNKAILSQAPGKYAGDMTLGQLRKLTPGMSSFSRIHRFCTSDGTAVTDETISFEDYLALEAVEEEAAVIEPAEKKESASAEEKAKTEAKAAAESKDKGEKTDAEEAATGKADSATKSDKDEGKPATAENEKEKDSTAKTPPKPTPKAIVPKLHIYYRSPMRVATAGMDLSTVTAPALNMGMRPFGGAGGAGGGAAGLDANGNALPSGPAAGPTPPSLDSIIGADKSFGANSGGNTASVTAGNLSEEQWNVVLRNCAVFYGWKVDKSTGQITRAPRAAFQLRSKLDAEPVAQIPMFAVDQEAIARRKAEAEDAEFERSLFARADVDSEALERVEQQNSEDAQVIQRPSLEPSQIKSVPARSLKGIPNFRVNDDSKIEIAACQDTLAVSLAKSDFSSQSTEASVAGGAYGVTVGVSAGVATSNENKNVDENSSSTQTLVARYMYPRCDIFLRAEDLEPTPEFATLLNKAKMQKSIDAVRAIHDQYGQLFCQELTLGARLLTSKIITATKAVSVEQHKEQMKVSVGVSVQTPYGGASVKHEQEKGEATDKSRTTTSTRETNVFEAVGGDTILANNPAAWANTVSSPNLWRVINRDGLSTMIDMLSEMPDYEKVQSWFVQAVPALNKYIRLGPALSVNVRFKVETPTNSLSVENRGNAIFYLGFKPSSVTTPRLNGMEASSGDGYWIRVDVKETHVLFHPASFRAPCLHGFDNFSVGDAPFGSKYNAEFAETQWNLISPFGDEFKTGTPFELKHGSRIILQTVPFRDPNAKPSVDGKDNTPPPCHMVVFRNAQGAFLPGISDRDEYQYWRIEKTKGGVYGEPIKGGESVRLCWKFADQVTGFRDYTDDVFGRRQNQCPPELESRTLYLKVPWPRFEVRNCPTAMMMSDQSTTDATPSLLQLRPGNYTYNLQDVQFRIDTVEKRGLGDSSDYMLAGVNQEADERTTKVSVFGRPLEELRPAPAPSPMQIWRKIAAFGLFGGHGF